jgi:hypothetical protein
LLEPVNPLPLNLPSAGAARDYVYNYLVSSGWAVEKIGTDAIQINGYKNQNGTIDAVKSLSKTVTNWTGGAGQPQASGTAGVTVTNN